MAQGFLHDFFGNLEAMVFSETGCAHLSFKMQFFDWFPFAKLIFSQNTMNKGGSEEFFVTADLELMRFR